MPSNAKVSSSRISDEFWNLENSIAKVVDFINNNGGLIAISQYKREEITDQSLIDENNSNNQVIGNTEFIMLDLVE